VNSFTGNNWDGATIYLSAGYYNSSPDWQADTMAHEILHAEDHVGDEGQLAGDIGASGSITQWISDGCPP
jgi:hypothetical protein